MDSAAGCAAGAVPVLCAAIAAASVVTLLSAAGTSVAAAYTNPCVPAKLVANAIAQAIDLYFFLLKSQTSYCVIP